MTPWACFSVVNDYANLGNIFAKSKHFAYSFMLAIQNAVLGEDLHAVDKGTVSPSQPSQQTGQTKTVDDDISGKGKNCRDIKM